MPRGPETGAEKKCTGRECGQTKEEGLESLRELHRLLVRRMGGSQKGI